MGTTAHSGPGPAIGTSRDSPPLMPRALNVATHGSATGALYAPSSTSEGGEVPRERTLVRATHRRLQMWIPLLPAFGFVLVADVPLAAGGRDQPVVASVLVSRTQASPGDNVTFWIWITPLKEKARNLIVAESNPDGFAVVSSQAPGSCLQTPLTWLC